jgi:hypothetical protein
MAYYAEIDKNNLVLRVVAIANENCLDENGIEQEQLGINRCLELFKTGIWKQTSYNTYGGVHLNGGNPLRKNYAGIGFTFDPTRNAFIAPKPEGEGWVFNEDKCIWENPEMEASFKATQLGVTYV